MISHFCIILMVSKFRQDTTEGPGEKYRARHFNGSVSVRCTLCHRSSPIDLVHSALI